MSLLKPRGPKSPRDHGLEEIAAWETWFRNAHEDILRDYPDTHLIEQERANVDALATAIAARMRSDYLARSQR
jgi:hypothetical protein